MHELMSNIPGTTCITHTSSRLTQVGSTRPIENVIIENIIVPQAHRNKLLQESAFQMANENWDLH